LDFRIIILIKTAAHDILNEESSNNSTTNTSGTTTVSPFNPNKTNKYDCNDLSTGTILLADIIPGILIKMIAPFFVHRIKYWQRVLMVILVNASSYLLVALAKSKVLIFLGVVCARFYIYFSFR
jgi:battenin